MSEKLLYLETNVINEYEKFSKNKKEVFRNKLKSNNLIPVTSEITLMEILSTVDNQKRENLIIACQEIFNNSLLIDLPLLILETNNQKFSNSKINNIWLDVIRNKNKTFIKYENDILNYKIGKEKISKKLIDISKIDFSNNGKCSDCDNKYCDTRNLNIAYYLTNLILLGEVEYFHNHIKKFWKEKNIFEEEQKILYIQEKLKDKYQNGIFKYMGNYANLQLINKPNRGLANDIFHCCYYPIVDIFISNDLHFQKIFKYGVISMKDFMNFSDLEIKSIINEKNML